MVKITIFGKGNMGSAIGKNFEDAGQTVEYIDSKSSVEDVGEIVVLAVPYDAAISIAKQQKDKLDGKIIIDITNPLNFTTFDELVVPADSSAAAQIAELLPNSQVVKGFNTTFAATLVSKKIDGSYPTTVQLASDSQSAKDEITSALDGSNLSVIDAGALKRARELEALGFLQLTLAASEKISWTGGFGIFK
ncbi:diguanylate cyclase [Tetragenococcus halophilus]|uniref:Diguanylate cyclase n=1 Tax=Tetragenococcus halophilus TaxID=51669 RepID=A0A3G5FHJ8_TETHA|nr:NADPH-dependent F420 reductase [Tetragenococcus halophilus]AYW49789.1 diguanylate cyclase [Tetragenococcus halophilus]GBD63111.1 Conserved domain protein [Tetragenococcus halophilus subsp. flandriensis]